MYRNDLQSKAVVRCLLPLDYEGVISAIFSHFYDYGFLSHSIINKVIKIKSNNSAEYLAFYRI